MSGPPASRGRGHHLPPRLLLGGRRHRLPAAGDRSARPDLRPVGGARDRDEAVSDRVHPRRRRPGHRLPGHARRPPRLGDVPRPGGLRRLRRRPARPRPRAVPPGRARPARQPVPVRAGLCPVHELRGRADGAPDRTPPHPVAGKRRPGRPERPPVRRRGRLVARGLPGRARNGARPRRGPARRHRPGDPDDRVRRQPDGLADRRRAPVAGQGDRRRSSRSGRRSSSIPTSASRSTGASPRRR